MREDKLPGRARFTRLVYLACCILATVQFVWIYLSRTPSGIDFAAYEQGLERTPFQSRLLLMEPLRWAHNSSTLHACSERLGGLPAWFPGGVSPEGIAEAGVDFVSLLLACWAGFQLYRKASRHGLLGWLVWPLTLVLSFVTYSGATHHNIRFVYDLPGMAAFSLGLLLLYEGRGLLPFYALFVVATPNRETTLLLLPFLATRDRARGVKSLATLRSCLFPLAFWTGLHFWLAHRFAHNGSAAGPRFRLNLGSLLIPLSWPQIFSALGYLWPFLILHRRSVQDAVLKTWLSCYWVWLGFMAFFGLLVEPRIFGELIPLTACLITLILEQRLVDAAWGLDLGRVPRETSLSAAGSFTGRDGMVPANQGIRPLVDSGHGDCVFDSHDRSGVGSPGP